MKIIKHENGIELVPESKFEEECLTHIDNKGRLKVEFTDSWNRTGNLKIEFEMHPWDKRPYWRKENGS